jgi:hypothetical protein
MSAKFFDPIEKIPGVYLSRNFGMFHLRVFASHWLRGHVGNVLHSTRSLQNNATARCEDSRGIHHRAGCIEFAADSPSPR